MVWVWGPYLLGASSFPPSLTSNSLLHRQKQNLPVPKYSCPSLVCRSHWHLMWLPIGDCSNHSPAFACVLLRAPVPAPPFFKHVLDCVIPPIAPPPCLQFCGLNFKFLRMHSRHSTCLQLAFPTSACTAAWLQPSAVAHPAGGKERAATCPGHQC